MDLSGKKILICEEALIDYKGHFYTWIKAIRQMHLDAGAEVFVAGNVRVDPRIREELGVIPVYTVNSWDQSETTRLPVWRRHLRVFSHNWRVLSETRKALHEVGPVDVVLFPAVRVHHVLGLRLLCSWGLDRHFKRLVPFLLTSQAEYNGDFSSFQFPRQTILIKILLKSFAFLVRKQHVLLAGDSHITCNEYESLTGVPMTLFPSPGGTLNYPRTQPESGAPTFAMLGVSTWDKGIDVFQEAIIRFFEANPASQARFVLQWGVPSVSPEGRTIGIDERLRADPRLTLLERRLTDTEYAEFFGNADYIVLPYRRITYFNRLSGVAVEAACSGKSMLVTADTWLDWALHEFGSGFSFEENDAGALCGLIERCCNERTMLREIADQRKDAAFCYNSPERYLAILWNGAI